MSLSEPLKLSERLTAQHQARLDRIRAAHIAATRAGLARALELPLDAVAAHDHNYIVVRLSADDLRFDLRLRPTPSLRHAFMEEDEESETYAEVERLDYRNLLATAIPGDDWHAISPVLLAEVVADPRRADYAQRTPTLEEALVAALTALVDARVAATLEGDA